MIIYSIRVPRPLMTVSMAVITVLNSAEVVHFHYESRFPFDRDLQVPKTLKGSSNKLGPLGFQLENRCRAPLLNGTFRIGYTHKDRGCTIPDSSSPSCAIMVTTIKLEKVLVLS